MLNITINSYDGEDGDRGEAIGKAGVDIRGCVDR